MRRFTLALLIGASTAWSLRADAAAGGACGGVSMFDDGLQPTTQIYVSLSGSNQTGNGSPGNPYRTIAYAANQASPGTAIRIMPGTYAGGTFIENLHGTAAAPIWLGGVPGQPAPLIQGDTEGLHLIKCRYVVVEHLEVAGASGNGINADDGGEVSNPTASQFLIFRSLFIRDIGGTGNQDGLKLSGIRDFVVADCRMERTGGGGSGSGIDMVGCHRGLIARCRFQEMSANAVQVKGGSSEVEVRWCHLSSPGQRAFNIGGSTGLSFFRPPPSPTGTNWEARDIRVLANMIEGGTAAVAFVGCQNCLFAHNTLDTPENWVLRILQETTTGGGYVFGESGDNTFASNLIYFSRGALSRVVNIGPNTRPATFTFANNLWYAHDQPSNSEPDLPAPEIDPVIGQDPLLVDPAADNYRVMTGSPAIGAGRTPPPLAGDAAGVCYKEPPTIGAYERLLGDLNCDALVDNEDIDGFVLALTNPPGYRATHPACDATLADANGDGAVDNEDIDPFVELLLHR